MFFCGLVVLFLDEWLLELFWECGWFLLILKVVVDDDVFELFFLFEDCVGVDELVFLILLFLSNLFLILNLDFVVCLWVVFEDEEVLDWGWVVFWYLIFWLMFEVWEFVFLGFFWVCCILMFKGGVCGWFRIVGLVLLWMGCWVLYWVCRFVSFWFSSKILWLIFFLRCCCVLIFRLGE